MARRFEHLLHRTFFDYDPVLHHGDPIGNLCDDAEVVRDEQDSGSLPRLQLLYELQDAGLCGDVESGGGLVGDEHRRLERERHCNHRALTLPSR
jgi:hypothetical protein